MVPEVAASNLPKASLALRKQPTLTYTPDLQRPIDGLEAMKQAILLILSIERYDWAIYSPDYGIELNDLYGQSPYYVYPELKRRIVEALKHDDRVIDVYDFTYEVQGEKLIVTFNVNTDYGQLEGIEVEADVA